MQITPLVPISGQGDVAPADPNAQLYDVLTKLLANNKPTSTMDGATPDQKAADKATAKTEENGKKAAMPAGQTVATDPKKDTGSAVLPNIIEQLFGSQSEKPAGATAHAAPEQRDGGLTSLLKTFRGGSSDNKQGIGTAIKTIMSLFA